MPRSPVTEIIERYNALTEEQQKVFLDLVDPQPEPEVPKVKRTRKKKADAPAAQKRGLPATSSSGQHCVFMDSDQFACDLPEDNPVHDPKGGYGGYHPFEPPAQPATKRSSRKGAGTSSTANTEVEKASALAAGAGGD